MRKLSLVSATAIAVSLSACSGGVHQSAQPAKAPNALARMPVSFAHGPQIESAQNIIVTDGNNHAAFPPGATVHRTATALEVTYHGVTRTFSPSATVATGWYRRYAKPQ